MIRMAMAAVAAITTTKHQSHMLGKKINRKKILCCFALFFYFTSIHERNIEIRSMVVFFSQTVIGRRCRHGSG